MRELESVAFPSPERVGGKGQPKSSLLYGIVAVLLVSGVTAALCEVGFRHLLFSNAGFMKKFRSPDLYFTYDSDDNYWKLYYLFQGSYLPPERPHPLLGWVGQFSRETYVHNQATEVGTRVPVLLYGDSYAECSTIADKRQCFQGLLNEDGSFSGSHYLLNYGVGGYGLDQILLLLRNSLDRYNEPFVVVGIMTWDLDRSAHSVRIGQKPYFRLENGGLVLRGVPVNPNASEFFARNPPEVGSYLLRLWAHSDGPLWRVRQAVKGLEGKYSSMAVLNEKILEELIEELGKRKTRHLFVIFYPDWVHESPADWRESLIKRVLDRHNQPYISTREFVYEDAKKRGASLSGEYYRDGHPTAYQYQLVADRIKTYIHDHSRESEQAAEAPRQSVR